MSETNFFVRNRAAIILAVLAGASAAGTYYYYQQSQQLPKPAPDAGQKKKKASKKLKKEATADAADLAKAAIYPVDASGFPNISELDIADLTDKDKEEWATALKNAGNDKYKTENFEDAIKFYTAALQVKIDPVFYSNRSACYAALNKHEEVIADATEAIKIKPDYAKCIMRRAHSYEALERYPDAMFDLTALTIYGGFNAKPVELALEKVLQKQSLKIVEENLKTRVPELPSAATMSSFFGAYVPESEPEGISLESTGADKFLYDALAAINANTAEKYADADTLFNQAVEAYKVDSLTSESPEAAKATIALEYAATVNFLKNVPANAAKLIERAMSLKPRARTYVLRALINADNSSITEALTDFEQAQKMDPENGDVYYHLGQLYYLTSDFAKAKENFAKAKEYNPENLYAYIQLACIEYKIGNFDVSDKAFLEAKQRFPTSPEVLNYYGEILADHGDIDGAIRQYEIAARLQEALPTFSVGATPLINKASLISREGLVRLAEAEELLTKACELDPKSEIARITLAQVKLQSDKPEEAIGLFEESSRLARTIEEKIQATSFAEATKMQLRIKADEVLGAKIREYMVERS